MKILILSSHTSSLCWFRVDMMKELVDLGHQVFAVGNECSQQWIETFAKDKITYFGIRVSRNGINPLSDIKTLIDLYHIIKKIQPDRIFAYHAKTIIYGSVAARILGYPEFYTLIAGLGSVFIGQTPKIKFVRSIMKTEYGISCRFSRKVLFHNPDDRDYFVHEHLVDKDKTEIINGSGVNLERFVPVAYPEQFAFLFIGRLIKDKGLVEYLKACEKFKLTYPHIRCLLLGPYDTNPSSIHRDFLEPYIRLGTIEYFGEQEDVRPIIRQSSVFVLPSYREGTPKTIIESMAMGRAIVTTDVPGCRETVQDGVNGFLVNVQDEEDLYDKMKMFIEFPELIERMGQKSIEIAKMNYDVRKVNMSIFKAMNLVE